MLKLHISLVYREEYTLHSFSRWLSQVVLCRVYTNEFSQFVLTEGSWQIQVGAKSPLINPNKHIYKWLWTLRNSFFQDPKDLYWQTKGVLHIQSQCGFYVLCVPCRSFGFLEIREQTVPVCLHRRRLDLSSTSRSGIQTSLWWWGRLCLSASHMLQETRRQYP